MARLAGTGSSFDVVAKGRRLGPVTLRIPGRHNALNATAALAAGLALGFPEGVLREGLGGFTGTRRRVELKGTAGGVRVFDDYAHHPTEIVAVLRAARGVAGTGRLVVAFQPHRYSRTAAFRQEFGEALGLADDVVVLEVYAAGEDPMPGASGVGVAAAVPLPARSRALRAVVVGCGRPLAEHARPGDVVLTLGAGDVTMIGPETLALLAAGGDACSAGTTRLETRPSVQVADAAAARLVRRRRAVRRRRWLKVAGFVGLLALAAAGRAGPSSGRRCSRSRRWRSRGPDRISAADVRSAADVPMGRPLARLDVDEVQRRVAVLANVASVVVTRGRGRGR